MLFRIGGIMYVMKKSFLFCLLFICGIVYSSSPTQNSLSKDKFLMTVNVWSKLAFIEPEKYHFFAETNKRGKLKRLIIQQEQGERFELSLKQLKKGISFANIRPESIERAELAKTELKAIAEEIQSIANAEVFDREATCIALLEMQNKMRMNRISAEECAGMMEQTTQEQFRQQAPMFTVEVDKLVELIEKSDYSQAPIKLKLLNNQRRYESGQRYTFELASTNSEEKTQFYLQRFDNRWLPYHIAENAYIGYDSESGKSIDEGNAFVVDILQVDWDNSNQEQLIDSVHYSSPMTGGHANLWNIAGGKEMDIEKTEKEYQDSLYGGRREIFSKYRARVLKENGFPKPVKEN